MKCPECVRLGLKSQFNEDRVTRCDGKVERFWDEDGKKHVHDHTKRTFIYSCSNGHHFRQDVVSECPREECAWNDQPLVKANREPVG